MEGNRIDPVFLDKTIAFWQPKTSRKLSQEDARQIIENAAGFIRILTEWDKKTRSVENPSDPHPGSNSDGQG